MVMGEGPVTLYRPDAVAWAVNLGGPARRTLDGLQFAADALDLTARRGVVKAVSGTQDPEIFRTFRAGKMQLRKALPNGHYDVTLYFIEPEDIPAGARIFSVRVQGETRINHLDVRRARDNTVRSALSRTLPDVEVSDGQLLVEFEPVTGQPVLSAILVRSRQPDTSDWEPLWSDEFNYEGPPDPARWNIEIWEARRVNDEDQAYTDRPRNVRVTGGKLVLEAHREGYGGAAYTSGRIQSQGKGDWLYGRVDIRARLPGGQGTWPALWMMPSDGFRYATRCSADRDDWQGSGDCDAWPNSGEIDIMEHVGYDMTRLHATVHNKAYYWKNNEQRKGSVEVRDLDRAFHVYSMVWTPEQLTFYFEGIPYFTYVNEGDGWESWPYDHPYHMIFNLAIGGQWGRAGGPIDETIFPTRLEVDYVRIFKPASAK